MYVPACLCVYHMCAGTHGGQKMSSDTLELELQAVVSLPVWGVGTKPISPVSEVIIMAAPFPQGVASNKKKPHCIKQLASLVKVSLIIKIKVWVN